MPIKRSSRLDQVTREFYGYSDRRLFFRLDRNEDPVGWEDSKFAELKKSLIQEDFAAYSDSNELLSKLSEWTSLPEENIYITAGADGAIKNIFEVYIDPKDKILMQDPCWPMYWDYANVYQALSIKQGYQDNLKFNIKHFINTINLEKPRLVILANPNMPTGTMISKKDILDIAKSCNKNNSLLIIDEAYHLFSSFSSVDLLDKFDNLIIVRTFSKAFGLAGLRIGYCLASKEIINNLMLVRPIADSNNIALKTAVFALDNFHYVNERINSFIEGREFLYDKFINNGIKSFKSDGNFLLIGCNTFDKAKKALNLISQRKYLLKGPYTSYPLENFIRVTIGPLDLMKQFWHDCSEIIIEASKEN